MKVVLLPQAQKDLDAIFDPLLSRLIRRLQVLEQFPQMGASLMGPFIAYRSMIVGTFRVVYRVLPAGVIEIAYIRSTAGGLLRPEWDRSRARALGGPHSRK